MIARPNLVFFSTALWVTMSVSIAAEPTPDRPNILMIAIDDLNDWVEPLEGHPDVKTPALAKLAHRAVTFTNAHCQAPLCNPSRTSIMTGLRPTSTGVYGLAPWFRTLPEFKAHVTLPQYFHQHGYHTLIGGKIFHGAYGRNGKAPQECDVWGPNASVGAKPEQKLIPPTPNGNHPLMDWGTFPHRDQDKGDWQVASWAVQQIESMQEEKPFFLSVGFFLPHVPCYATQKWFDLYPEDSLTMPPMPSGDRSDTPKSSWYLHWNLPEPRTDWLAANDQLRPLVRAYLASISFVDSQVGRVLDALENSPYADNTIVVLWSDHGYHLGEKSISGKNSLWARSTRVPLIFAGPGIAANVKCNQPAELLDLYPTLASLAGLPRPNGVQGISLEPQLSDPTTPRDRPAICTHNAGNHSVCDTRWRYIRYLDGGEELYDVAQDPNEFDNLLASEAGRAEFASVVHRLRAWLPKNERGLATGSAHRILEQRADGIYWEKKKIDMSRIPQ
ncbi:Choline-sulfatase [Novipirellula galeiformis]|uniref:Choline-sulfatase n=1 Tax=Novipirellula galeiformis TaxID=2528004 RepID=A0A5C6CN11_9BACT|nr:sulfatase [Novipirellula galeiformis]TWU24967.1 Choline-sulfatase [Novipirellula galeiformis]